MLLLATLARHILLSTIIPKLSAYASRFLGRFALIWLNSNPELPEFPGGRSRTASCERLTQPQAPRGPKLRTGKLHCMADLVLLRHGESTWNAENLFTGWTDVDLSSRGEAEAAEAGRVLAEEEAGGLELKVVHTSVLTRAVRTANLALDVLGRSWLPVRRHWRLNERHYGALQGMNKKQTAEEFGLEQVKLWRRSYSTPPPPLSLEDERHPVHDRRYAGLPLSALPSTECLADVVKRMTPYWEDAIVPDLRTFGAVFVVAHGNSIRALAKHLLSIPDGEIVGLEVPTGVPWVFRLDDKLDVKEERFIGDPAAVAEAAAAVARQAG
jgi:2,3-bisphosphoglycerate-dependent phosphoglycerate mutase